MNKQVRGKKMFAMPNKKDKSKRPQRKQKHKAQFVAGW
jgi:hypothetical protein